MKRNELPFHQKCFQGIEKISGVRRQVPHNVLGSCETGHCLSQTISNIKHSFLSLLLNLNCKRAKIPLLLKVQSADASGGTLTIISADSHLISST